MSALNSSKHERMNDRASTPVPLVRTGKSVACTSNRMLQCSSRVT